MAYDNVDPFILKDDNFESQKTLPQIADPIKENPDLDHEVAKLEQVKTQIKNDSNKLRNMTALDVRRSGSGVLDDLFKKKDNRLNTQEFDVDIRDSHAQLNDGSFVARFDDYMVGTNNEQRHALNQSKGEKWANGLIKFGSKTGLNILDGTVGSVVGLVEGIKEGSLSAVFNNDFSHWIDDQNKKLDNNLSNYYTENQKNMGFMKSMTTADFWANDFLGGMSFMAGTIASEGIWALATGGASIPVSMARLGLKASAKAAAKAGAKNLSKKASAKLAKMAAKDLKNLSRVSSYSNMGKALNNTRFLYTSAAYEGGVEARHHLDESLESYMTSFEKVHGRVPKGTELGEFMDAAISNSNKVFMANIALVGASNILQFGKYFGVNLGIKKSLSKFSPSAKLFGLGTKTVTKDGKLVTSALKQTAKQRYASIAVNGVRDMFTEGVIEEGGQSVISNTSQRWLASRYNPDAIDKSYTVMEAAYESAMHTYGTKEGFKEVGLGMLIGKAGQARARGKNGNITPFGIGENASEVAYNEKIAKAQNEARNNFTQAQKRLMDRTLATNQITTYQDAVDKGIENNDFTETSRNWEAAQYSYFNALENGGTLEDAESEFNRVMDFTPNAAIAAEHGVAESEVESLKTELKSQFKANLETFSEARAIAEALAPQSASGQDFTEELAFNIYMGVGAWDRAQGLSKSIEDFVGVGGMGSGITLMARMNDAQKAKLTKAKKLQTQVKNLETRFNRLQAKMGLQGEKANKNSVRLAENNRESLEKVRQELIEAQAELDGIETQLSKELAKKPADFGGNLDIWDGDSVLDTDIMESLYALGDLDIHLEALRKDNPFAASQLEAQMGEYRLAVKDFRDFSRTFERMADPRFRQDYKGIFGLKNILNLAPMSGTKSQDYENYYDMFSKEDLENFINENKANDNLTENERFTLETLFMLGASRDVTKLKELDPIRNEDWKYYEENEYVTPEMEEGIMARAVSGVRLSPRQTKIYLDNKKIFDETILDRRIKNGDAISIVIPKKQPVQVAEQFDESFLGKLKQQLSDALAKSKITDSSVKDALEVEKPTKKHITRYNNLVAKEKGAGLNKKEQTELDNLRTRFNEYGRLQGMDLLGLIDEINEYEALGTVGAVGAETIGEGVPMEDVLPEDEFPDTPRGGAFTYLQTYDKVFLRGQGKFIYISHISLAGLLNNIIGTSAITVTQLKGKNNKRVPVPINGGKFRFEHEKEDTFEVDIDGQIYVIKITGGGNLRISKEGFQNLTENTPYSTIKLKTNNSNYTPLQIERDGELVAVDTDFTHHNKGIGMDVEAVYELRKGNKLHMVVDLRDPHNVKLVKRYKAAKTKYENDSTEINRKAFELAAKRLEDDLVIYEMRTTKSGERFIGVSKSTLDFAETSKADGIDILREVRSSAVKQVLENLDENEVTLDETAIVSGMYVGHPNVLNKDGKITYVKIDANNDRNVVTFGYMLDGELVLDDTSVQAGKHPFMTKIGKSETYKGKKVPVIVFRHKGRNIAYPAKMREIPSDNGARLKEIFDNATTKEEAVKGLNKLLHSLGISLDDFGIDSRLDGDALVKEVEIAVQQIEAQKSFADMSTATLDDYMVNIDLNDPVHSPKVKVQYNVAEPIEAVLETTEEEHEEIISEKPISKKVTKAKPQAKPQAKAKPKPQAKEKAKPEPQPVTVPKGHKVLDVMEGRSLVVGEVLKIDGKPYSVVDTKREIDGYRHVSIFHEGKVKILRWENRSWNIDGNPVTVFVKNNVKSDALDIAKDWLIHKLKLKIVAKANGYHIQKDGRTTSIYPTLEQATLVLNSRVSDTLNITITKDIDLGDGVSVSGMTIDGITYSILNTAERMVTVVDIDGVKVPFYLTTGKGGKNLTPAWYPFFGYSEFGWLNKTSGADMDAYYERYIGEDASNTLKNAAKKLNARFGITPNSIKQTGFVTIVETQNGINSVLGFKPAENKDLDPTVSSTEERAKLERNIKSIGSKLGKRTPVTNPKESKKRVKPQSEPKPVVVEEIPVTPIKEVPNEVLPAELLIGKSYLINGVRGWRFQGVVDGKYSFKGAGIVKYRLNDEGRLQVGNKILEITKEPVDIIADGKNQNC